MPSALFLGGFLRDQLAPRWATEAVLGGHCLALGLVALHLSGTRTLGAATFLGVGAWSLFSWGLSPVVQAAILRAAPSQPMPAMALGISGLYGGSAVGRRLLLVAVLCAVWGTRPTSSRGGRAASYPATSSRQYSLAPQRSHSGSASDGVAPITLPTRST